MKKFNIENALIKINKLEQSYNENINKRKQRRKIKRAFAIRAKILTYTGTPVYDMHKGYFIE